MKNENLIHVKLEYEEALQSKKDILSSEMSFLKISKIIKEYQELRLQELKLKSKLHRKIKETITNIKKLQLTLPKSNILKKLKKGENAQPNKIILPKKTHNELEYQLEEIQNKLKALSR